MSIVLNPKCSTLHVTHMINFWKENNNTSSCLKSIKNAFY